MTITDTFDIEAPTVRNQNGARAAAVYEQLVEHCRTVDLAADGTFSLPLVSLQTEYGVAASVATAVIARLIDAGVIVRVRPGGAGRFAAYVRATEHAAARSAATVAAVTCTTCGYSYVPDGPCHCCPKTLTWSHTHRRNAHAQS